MMPIEALDLARQSAPISLELTADNVVIQVGSEAFTGNTIEETLVQALAHVLETYPQDALAQRLVPCGRKAVWAILTYGNDDEIYTCNEHFLAMIPQDVKYITPLDNATATCGHVL